MKNLLLALPLLFALVLSSCGKKVAEVNPQYIGTWENIDGSGDRVFEITNGISTYVKYEGASTVNAEGKAKIKGNERKLKIGLLGFKIDKGPYKETYIVDGVKYEDYFMELEGITFIRY